MANFLADPQLPLAGRARTGRMLVFVCSAGHCVDLVIPGRHPAANPPHKHRPVENGFRAPPWGGPGLTIRSLQCAGDLLDLEAFDDVADLNVLVVLERHAALVALADLAHLFLEPL